MGRPYPFGGPPPFIIGGGPLRIIPGGGPVMEGALPRPLPPGPGGPIIGPFPFAPFIIRGGGTEDNLTGGFTPTGDATTSFLC